MKSRPFALVIEPLEDRIAPTVFIVSTTADSGPGSLRQAITSANNDLTANAVDSIVFQKSPGVPLHGTITLKTSLPAIAMATGDSLTITGPTAGKSNGITINGNKHQILSITGGAVTMTDLTVTQGLATEGGGIYINDDAAISLTDVTITHNQAMGTTSSTTAYGGGVFISSVSGNVTITKSAITNNVCTGLNATPTSDPGYADGGGIICRGTLTISESVVSGNVAHAGSAKTGDKTLGAAGAYGGGIYASETDANVTIESCTVSGNKSIGGNGGNGAAHQSGGRSGYGNGGGVYSWEGVLVIGENTTISKNTAESGGGGKGGIDGDGGKNRECWGGGVSSAGGSASLTIQNSTISGNKVLTGKAGAKGAGGTNGETFGTYGGGVYSGRTATISQTTITGNSAKYGGGFYSDGGSSTIIACTISKNKASAWGGGVKIGVDAAALTIENSTVAKNVSVGNGAGLAIDGGTNDQIYNDTIADNTVTGKTGEGGGVYIASAVTSDSIISTILAGDKAHTGADLAFANGNNTTIDNCLIEAAISGTSTNESNIFTGNPLLGTLGLHDGGTTATMVPGAGSKALGNGSNPASLGTDQNGNPRTGSGSVVDIGSVEVTQ